jgi:hypothetical protein
MQNQIRKFSALLNEVEIGKAFDLFVEGMKTDEVAQNGTRVVETERLVEVACQKILLCHKDKTPSFCPRMAGARADN